MIAIEDAFEESSFKSVDLSNFKSPKLTYLRSVFYGCRALEKNNLSYISTATITNAAFLFAYCENLKSLDISGLTFGSDGSYDYYNYEVDNLKYINIKDATLTEDVKNLFKGFNNLKICQDKPIIIKDNFTYVCEYESENYMTIYLRAGSEGFTFDFDKYYKDNILFVLSDGTGISKEELSSQRQLSSEIKIYFSPPLTTLESFFEGDNIISVDLSHFDASLITSFQKMFRYSYLSSIDLSNFYAPSLTNMASMFEGCSYLLSVNLGSLSTSKVNDTGNMFKGCENLKLLEINGFNFTSEASNTILFESLPNLKYLNIKDVEFTDSIKEQFRNIIFAKDEITICQDDDLNIEKIL